MATKEGANGEQQEYSTENGQYIKNGRGYDSKDNINRLKEIYKKFQGGTFVKNGETTETQPDRKEEIYRGSDKYPRTTRHYEFIKSAKNGVVEINLDTEIQKQFDKATPRERQNIAFRYIMDNLRGKYPTKDGREILVERVGADKMSHTLNELKIRVLPELANLIEVSKFNKIVKVDHKIFDKFAYYNTCFSVNNEKYSAFLNVGIRKNGLSTLYDINPFNKK